MSDSHSDKIIQSIIVWTNVSLRNLLKLLRVQQVLISRGRLFHDFGAVTENDISPYVFSLDAGMVSKCWWDDCSWQEGTYAVKSSERY